MSMRKMSPKKSGSHSPEKRGAGTYWIHGRHAVLAALANPERKFRRLLVTANSGNQLGRLPKDLQPEIAPPQIFTKFLGEEAVHQGFAAEVMPLLEADLRVCAASGKPIIMLDQVTDPHNVGAILRSAAAFDAACVIVPRMHAPEETGVLAKSASGALEIVPVVRVTNLSQTLDELKKEGYWCAGLDGAATQTLESAKLGQKTVLVMGAEGAGLRRLTAENCDLLIKLPMSDAMESLNVSNAAAISLYYLFTQRKPS